MDWHSAIPGSRQMLRNGRLAFFDLPRYAPLFELKATVPGGSVSVPKARSNSIPNDRSFLSEGSSDSFYFETLPKSWS